MRLRISVARIFDVLATIGLVVESSAERAVGEKRQAQPEHESIWNIILGKLQLDQNIQGDALQGLLKQWCLQASTFAVFEMATIIMVPERIESSLISSLVRTDSRAWRAAGPCIFRPIPSALNPRAQPPRSTPLDTSIPERSVDMKMSSIERSNFVPDPRSAAPKSRCVALPCSAICWQPGDFLPHAEQHWATVKKKLHFPKRSNAATCP